MHDTYQSSGIPMEYTQQVRRFFCIATLLGDLQWISNPISWTVYPSSDSLTPRSDPKPREIDSLLVLNDPDKENSHTERNDPSISISGLVASTLRAALLLCPFLEFLVASWCLAGIRRG